MSCSLNSEVRDEEVFEAIQRGVESMQYQQDFDEVERLLDFVDENIKH